VLRGRREATIPVADGQAIHAPWRRTIAVRAVLGAGIVALLVVCVLVARGLAAPHDSVFAGGKSGVVVVDISRSIGPGKTPSVLRALQRVDGADRRAGLVLFSDIGYELLPPGSPGTEIRTIERFLTPVSGKRNAAGGKVYLANPWDETFRGGTRVSVGLRAGMRALRRAGIEHGSILLISDLATEPNDYDDVATVASEMRHRHISIRIAPIFAKPGDLILFQRAFGRESFLSPKQSVGQSVRERAGAIVGAPLPWTLIVIAVVLLALLAGNELLCGRLSFARTEAT
jgi:hypothetical protein